MGDVVDGRSRRCDRARFTQSAELRPRTRHLHLCDYLCHLGSGLSLFSMDSKTAHPRLLATWMAVVSRTRRLSQHRPRNFPHRNSSAIADVHRKAVKVAMGDAPVDLLGMPVGGGDHLPTRIRMDLFH